MRCFSSFSTLTYDKNADCYEVLGVDSKADPKKIKLTYYKLAQKYHPDKAGDDTKAAEKFKQISNAYEILADEDMRKRYDTLRQEAKNPKMGFNSGAYGNSTGGYSGYGAGGKSTKQ